MANDKVKELEKRLAELEGQPEEGEVGEEKVRVLNDMGVELFRSRPEEARKLNQRALALAEKLDYRAGIAESCRIIGVDYLEKGDCKKALENFLKTLRIYEELGLKREIAGTNIHIGQIYMHQGKCDRALEYYQKAFVGFEDTNYKRGIGIAYDSIGSVFYSKGNDEKALSYYLNSMNVFEEIGDRRFFAQECNNIGNIFRSRCDFEKALDYYSQSAKIKEEVEDERRCALVYSNIGGTYQDQGKPDKALEYYNKALEINLKFERKKGVAVIYNNIGQIHENQGDMDKALEYYQKSLIFNEEINDKKSIATSCKNIGRTYIRQEQFDKAHEYLMRSLQISEEIGTKQNEYLCYLGLSELYESQGDLEKALDYYKKYSLLKQEIFNEESTKKIAQMQVRYETERKEKEAEIYRLKTVELERLVEKRTAEVVRSAKLATVGVFASGIAHQVNNPLNVMMFSADGLKEIFTDRVQSAEVRNQGLGYVNDLEEEIAHTRKIVKSLLGFTREREIHIVPTDINALVQKAVDFVNTNASARNFNIEAELENDLGYAAVDPDGLEQVIVNVIQNAYDACEGKGTAVIKTSGSENTIRISIANDGPPIPEDIRDKIFEPLFTTKGEGKGTGLGLSISAMLLDRLGGRIFLESCAEKLTTFVIEIPVSEEVG
ncbi:tetratricopeptide repeat protein [candidate division WOR-3 bacterium]|nr:tetratricopeptide repeat protein [candidate division WOR-3 bacterium]